MSSSLLPEVLTTTLTQHHHTATGNSCMMIGIALRHEGIDIAKQVHEPRLELRLGGMSLLLVLSLSLLVARASTSVSVLLSVP
jgi:hypothetical protein